MQAAQKVQMVSLISISNNRFIEHISNIGSISHAKFSRYILIVFFLAFILCLIHNIIIDQTCFHPAPLLYSLSLQHKCSLLVKRLCTLRDSIFLANSLATFLCSFDKSSQDNLEIQLLYVFKLIITPLKTLKNPTNK